MKRSSTFEGRVRLLWCREDDADDLPKNWQDLASPPERERASNMKSSARAYTFLRTRALLRQELAVVTGLKAPEISIKQTPEGRPFLALADTSLDFSLSHSEGHIFIGILEGGRLGIDLQYMDTETPVEKLAKRFFTPEEYRAVESAADTRTQFFKIWSLKEARFKLGDVKGAKVEEEIGISGDGFAYAVCCIAA